MGVLNHDFAVIVRAYIETGRESYGAQNSLWRVWKMDNVDKSDWFWV
jgi:hypothetical protein